MSPSTAPTLLLLFSSSFSSSSRPPLKAQPPFLCLPPPSVPVPSEKGHGGRCPSGGSPLSPSPEGSRSPEVAQFPHTTRPAWLGVKMSSSWWWVCGPQSSGTSLRVGVVAPTGSVWPPHAPVSLPSSHTISITQNISPVPLSTSHPSPLNHS